MRETTIVASATIPPASDFVRSTPLPGGRKTITAAAIYGTPVPGFLSAASWAAPRPTGSPFGDPNAIAILPDQIGQTKGPEITGPPIPMCVPLPPGYDTLYTEYCNATGTVRIITHVIRVRY